MNLASLTAIAAIALCGSVAQAQGSYKKELPDSLTKVAKITESMASAAAQSRVPKGKIQSVELEREDGKLIYSYDIKTTGKSGIDEVHVDATSGKVIGFAHESPADEKSEAAADAKAAKSAKAKKP
jgi:uncharacterized membrane protein YkoI